MLLGSPPPHFLGISFPAIPLRWQPTKLTLQRTDGKDSTLIQLKLMVAMLKAIKKKKSTEFQVSSCVLNSQRCIETNYTATYSKHLDSILLFFF